MIDSEKLPMSVLPPTDIGPADATVNPAPAPSRPLPRPTELFHQLSIMIWVAPVAAIVLVCALPLIAVIGAIVNRKMERDDGE